MQLHETVQNESGQMVMREVEGGFVIPAHGSLELTPGGNHLMFMDLTAPLRAGDETTITLTFSGQSTPRRVDCRTRWSRSPALEL